MCCSLRGDRADSQDFDFARAVDDLQLSELLPYVRSAPLDAQAQSIVGEHATVVFNEFFRRFVHEAQRFAEVVHKILGIPKGSTCMSIKARGESRP